MSDRELLEAAARAAGIEQPTGQDGYVAQDGTFVFYLDCEGKTSRRWNPLTDDGDALRLAVKLRIMVDPDGDTYAVATACPKGRGEFMASEKHCGDPYAATRRAIVRAAAETAREKGAEG